MAQPCEGAETAASNLLVCQIPGGMCADNAHITGNEGNRPSVPGMCSEVSVPNNEPRSWANTCWKANANLGRLAKGPTHAPA